MARHHAIGAHRPMAKGVSSFACLAFVAGLGAAFWAGAVYIGEAVLRVSGGGF